MIWKLNAPVDNGKFLLFRRSSRPISNSIAMATVHAKHEERIELSQLNSLVRGPEVHDVGPRECIVSLDGVSFGSKKETDLLEAYSNQVAEVNAMLAILHAHGPVARNIASDNLGWGHVAALDECGYQLKRVIVSLGAVGPQIETRSLKSE